MTTRTAAPATARPRRRATPATADPTTIDPPAGGSYVGLPAGAVELTFLSTRVLVKDPVTGRWRDRVQTAGTTTDPRQAFDALGRAAAVMVRGDRVSFTLPRDAATALVPSLAAAAALPSSGPLTARTA